MNRMRRRPQLRVSVKKKTLPFFLLVLLLTLAVCPSVVARTVTLPITLDYSLLRTLIVNEAFPEEGDRSTLVDEGGGCLYLALSNPKIS